MDIRKIKKLLELVKNYDITELEVAEGEESVRINRAPPASASRGRLSSRWPRD